MFEEELLAKYPKAVKRLKAGRTIREVAGECELSTKTVQKVRTALKMKELEKVVHEEEKAILSGRYTVH